MAKPPRSRHGPSKAEGRHAQDDHVRLGGSQVLLAQPETVEDARARSCRATMSAPCDQPARQIGTFGPAEVERHVTQADVRAVGDRRPFEDLRIAELDAAGEAHAVRPLDRLDLDDVGAHRRQVGRDERPGPERDERHDAQTLQRARRIRRRPAPRAG